MSPDEQEQFHEMARKDNKRYAEARKAWVKQKADKYLEFLEENVR